MSGEWRLVDDNPVLGKRSYMMDIDEDHAVMRTEYYRVNQIVDFNAEQRSGLAGRAWGDGQIVGRIPMNLLFDEKTGLFEAVRNGDDAFVNRWLNDSENRDFRVKEGKL